MRTMIWGMWLLTVVAGCDDEASTTSEVDDSGSTDTDTPPSEDVEAIGVIELTGDSTWSGTLRGRCDWFGDDELVESPAAIDLIDPDDEAFDFYTANPVAGMAMTFGLGEVDAGADYAIYTSTTETTTIERLPSGDVLVQATGTRLGNSESTASWTATVSGCVVE